MNLPQPAVEALGVEQIAQDEQRVVEATADYLIARQSPDDLPEQVDLDAVAAAYDHYVEDLHRLLNSTPST